MSHDEETEMTTRWIRHILLWTLIPLLMVLSATATSAQVVGNGYNNSLIYKIESGTNTVYILGSLHALAEEYYPLTRSFTYSYYDSQKVIFEIDPTILFTSTPKPEIVKQSMFTNGMTIQKALTPKTYQLLTKKLRQMGISPKEVEKFKPWKLYLLVGGTLDSAKDFRPDLGIERYFYQMAKDAGKETGGLETLEDQLNVFDTLSFKEQEALLLEVLQNGQTQEKQFVQMVKSWHQGNLAGMERFVETFKAYPKYYQAILVKRNHNWVPQIEAFLKDTKNYFVVVGVAHLPGEDGLIALLEKKGYTLERVSFARP